jgi:CRISPR-associated protein Csc1
MYIATCIITLHDNLFYASREMGRLYETERYLHNYGLSYALGSAVGLRRPYCNLSQVPSYRTDLRAVADQGIYVTPALPLEYSFAFHTFKLGEPAYYSFTPQVISNRVVYGRAKELTVGSRFECFILSPQPLQLPRWVRLGKWMSKAALEVARAGSYEARTPREPVTIRPPLNPLDYPARALDSFDIINMPPVPLLVNARTTQPCYDVGDGKDRHAYIPANLAYFGAED